MRGATPRRWFHYPPPTTHYPLTAALYCPGTNMVLEAGPKRATVWGYAPVSAGSIVVSVRQLRHCFEPFSRVFPDTPSNRGCPARCPSVALCRVRMLIGCRLLLAIQCYNQFQIHVFRRPTAPGNFDNYFYSDHFLIVSSMPGTTP